MSVFRKHDAGALERSPLAKDQDCQVRALATARSITYGDAWALLYVTQGERRACGFVLTDLLAVHDERFGVVRPLAFPAKKGKPRMTPRAFCKLHPKGRFILRMAGHVACVKDGQLYDTHDCSDRCVYTAWEVSPSIAAKEIPGLHPDRPAKGDDWDGDCA